MNEFLEFIQTSENPAAKALYAGIVGICAALVVVVFRYLYQVLFKKKTQSNPKKDIVPNKPAVKKRQHPMVGLLYWIIAIVVITVFYYNNAQ